MDSGKFDDLTRAIGRGASRRTMLKGLLGLGGAGAVARTFGPDPTVDAARRPTPTPKPITCPGNQYWDGNACVCPGELDKCGPACCEPGVSECCDNACCYGECYGEELCCARVGDIQPLVCTSQTGTACCDVSDSACCTEDGCCAGTCYGGPERASYCCTGLVCDGMQGAVCYPDGECCNDSDCPPDPETCSMGVCTEGVCSIVMGECPEGQVCCGEGCCPEAACCETENGLACSAGGECCVDDQCPSNPETCAVGACIDGLCEQVPVVCEAGESCCGGACCLEANCCTNEGGFSVCLTAQENVCCDSADCEGYEPPACHSVACIYDEETGRSYCDFVNDCGENEICCNGECETLDECPECQDNEDCTGTPVCLNSTTLQVPVCVNGQCALDQISCETNDPCNIGSCVNGACITNPPGTCWPNPSTICCPPGWDCALPDATYCICQNGQVCEESGYCSECCSDGDCYSIYSGSPGCTWCGGLACEFAAPGTPCDLGGGFMGTCNGGGSCQFGG